VLLAPDLAQVIGVALHELATNAIKYGALSVSNGQVEITWSNAGDEKIILHWIEINGPTVKRPSRQGFGTTTIARMIEQLKGTMRLDWRTEGLECEIVFKV